ncbi:MAG: heme-binding protein [Clostridia bacterium]|nr:heme-binding protein [Clostridia bacterium]MBQ2237431.1 heme-binding protein [Clostridia bacterium]MEE1184796.1 heme-binding protein [Acutalibacteraceae bacterium]
MDEKALSSMVDAIVKQIGASPRDITLSEARSLSEKIRQKAESMGVKAVVAISNRAARPILVECMDDAYIASYDVAVQKAFTVVSLKMSTSDLKPLAQPGGSLYGIQFTNEGHIVIFGGGEPLRNSAGAIIGGLGVSGGSEEQDTALAAYGKEIFEKGGF